MNTNLNALERAHKGNVTQHTKKELTNYMRAGKKARKF